MATSFYESPVRGDAEESLASASEEGIQQQEVRLLNFIYRNIY